jgi:hypothetical protein
MLRAVALEEINKRRIEQDKIVVVAPGRLKACSIFVAEIERVPFLLFGDMPRAAEVDETMKRSDGATAQPTRSTDKREALLIQSDRTSALVRHRKAAHASFA